VSGAALRRLGEVLAGSRDRLRSRVAFREVALLPSALAEAAPLDLRIVGRTLFHAALVGAAAGLAGAAFFAALEYVQHLTLEQVAGYQVLRAHGEALVATPEGQRFRPWLLVLLPASGGLLCGLLTLLAPEARGGGGDATIDAFHRHDGVIRRRLIAVKPLASLFSLGTGGAGGREGPTMQIGGALGSLVGRALRVGARERRILMVAGVAAGISAVFRTPLGAALLAVEFLYRDGFESDALIPSVLASVVAYSVVIALFGESTLFAHAVSFPYHAAHLPLYGLLALVCAVVGAVFVAALRRSSQLFARLPLPRWAHPAVGGLALGVVATPIVWGVGTKIGAPGQGLGILGGGYGAVQIAISGAPWLAEGWSAVELLALLAVGKLVASSLTIGSGGSAGDFAPSLAIGGLLGGAFGRAALLAFPDAGIDPGAFALVGMGVFYGGIAHVPLSALVLVCEMAGNYDLLVPLMLALGIAFVATRRIALYEAQVETPRDSAAHRDGDLLAATDGLRVRDLMVAEVQVSFERSASSHEAMRGFATAWQQEVFPVRDERGALVGMITAAALRKAAQPGSPAWTVADLMRPAVTVGVDDDLGHASRALFESRQRAALVVTAEGRVAGHLDQDAIARTYAAAASRVAAAQAVAGDREA
jgi:CIC family chloride channel protein